MEVGAEEEEEGVDERRMLGLWPPTMASRSSRGEVRAARRGECGRVALTAARRSRRERQRARWLRRPALRDPRAFTGRGAPSVKAAALYGKAAFAGAPAFAGCGEGNDRRPSPSGRRPLATRLAGTPWGRLDHHAPAENRCGCSFAITADARRADGRRRDREQGVGGEATGRPRGHRGRTKSVGAHHSPFVASAVEIVQTRPGVEVRISRPRTRPPWVRSWRTSPQKGPWGRLGWRQDRAP